MPTLKDQAIQQALQNRWEEAIVINQEILKQNAQDIDTLNRLAYAYMQSSKFEDAKKIYEQVISMDTTNPIAVKNLRKLTTLASQANGNAHLNINHINHIDNAFIQEAGKTKTVSLTNITDKKTLMSLQHGDDVTLTTKRSKIFVLSQDKNYIGMLPDDVGIRLTTFIKGGNEYQACIKSVDDKNVTIFIKETKRAKKFSNQSSFT